MGRRALPPELRSLKRIVRDLEAHDQETRDRMLRYLVDRFASSAAGLWKSEGGFVRPIERREEPHPHG